MFINHELYFTILIQSKSPARLNEPSQPHHVPRGSSSSLTVSNAPHTITAPPSNLMRVNAFEECARTLQDQPPVDEFFPRVETQVHKINVIIDCCE